VLKKKRKYSHDKTLFGKERKKKRKKPNNHLSPEDGNAIR